MKWDLNGILYFRDLMVLLNLRDLKGLPDLIDLMGPTGPKGPHEPTGPHKPQGPTALRDLKNQLDFWDMCGVLHHLI